MAFPSPAEDHRENTLNLQDLVVHPLSTYFLKMSGVAMEPTIHAKDVLVVDRSLILLDYQVVVVVYQERFWTRRILQTDERILLIADNRAFEDVVVSREEDFLIWGVVTYAVHRLTSPTRRIRWRM